MAAENPTWGEGRIANELKLKLTIRVSPRMSASTDIDMVQCARRTRNSAG